MPGSSERLSRGKEALLADPSGVFFTTPHFDGSPVILVRLDAISVQDLEEVVVEAWLCRAPRRLAQGYRGVPARKRRAPGWMWRTVRRRISPRSVAALPAWAPA